MLSIRVRPGEEVMIGDLTVSAERHGPGRIELVARLPDGSGRRVTPPTSDLAPATLIKAADCSGRAIQLSIAAPRNVLIRRANDTRYCKH